MIITLKEIQSYGPCYDPKQYRITRISLVNLLKKETIPTQDRIWVACRVLAGRDREKFIDFAKWCGAYYASRQKQVDYLIDLIER